MNSKNYIRLFSTPGLKLFIDDIFMSYYRRLSVVTIYHEGEYTSYMPKDIFEKCLEEGVLLYGDNIKFDKYVSEFDELKIRLTKHCEKINDALTKEDLAKLFGLLKDAFHYYSKTEFFYTDKAYGIQECRDNLKQLSKLKTESREFLNNIYFGNHCHLSRLFNILSKRFDVPKQDLMQYSMKEVLVLYDGDCVGQEDISARDKAFVIGDRILQGERAVSIARSFRELTENIKGVVANKGKAQGPARIIVSGYKNYDSIGRLIDSMDQGDILITETTSPELIQACKKASAIVTNQGGIMSHAAVISRELGIPCIVGTDVATKILKNGDIVEVDAEKGVVRKV
ncbi:MAG: PEP-utilizing enzyme [Candidatus Nanoarchaeia archaeon]